MTSRHSSAPLLEPGRLHTIGGADGAAHAAPEHAEGLPRRVAGAPHGLRQARRLAVDDDPRALGREVARSEPGAAGGDHDPGESGDQVAEGERDFVDAVGGDLVVDHRPSPRR